MACFRDMGIRQKLFTDGGLIVGRIAVTFIPLFPTKYDDVAIIPGATRFPEK
jgi:hypothetical protein